MSKQTPVPSPLPKHRRIAVRRLRTLQRYKTLRRQGLSAARAARRVRSSVTTLWRFARLFQSHGLAGMVPRFQKSGRHAVAAPLPTRAREKLRFLMAGSGSVAAAIRQFAGHPDCPRALASEVRRRQRRGQSLPPSIRNAAGLRRGKIEAWSDGRGKLFIGHRRGVAVVHI